MSRRALTIVGAIICACVLGWGTIWIIRARSESAQGSCRDNLFYLDSLKQHWAIALKKTTNDIPTWDDLRPYGTMNWDKHQIVPPCPQGGKYTLGRLDEPPKCSIGGPGHSL